MNDKNMWGLLNVVADPRHHGKWCIEGPNRTLIAEDLSKQKATMAVKAAVAAFLAVLNTPE